MDAEQKTYYLDKLGITRWIYRQAEKRTSRLLVIHDLVSEPSEVSHASQAVLLDKICSGLELNETNSVVLSYSKPYPDLTPYFTCFDKVLILGEGLYQSIHSKIINQASELYIVKHRIGEGFTSTDKKRLYQQYVKWMM